MKKVAISKSSRKQIFSQMLNKKFSKGYPTVALFYSPLVRQRIVYCRTGLHLTVISAVALTCPSQISSFVCAANTKGIALAIPFVIRFIRSQKRF